MPKTVTLAPDRAVTVQAGDTMQLVVFTDTTVPGPPGWVAGNNNLSGLLGARACQSRLISRVAAGVADVWPQVTLPDGAWYTFTWYVGRPPGPELLAGYSWPQSGTITAGG